MRRFSSTLLFATLALVCLGGCRPYAFKLKEPPSGFAVVQEWDGHFWAKAGDDVGLKIASFSNVKGGTLAYWSYDLAGKLGDRGYKLVAQSPTESRNGIPGTRFDFEYTTPAGQAKFFTAVLFVSDDYRTVVQLAGNQEHRSVHDAELNATLGELKIVGCKLINSVCKSAQAPSYVGKLALGSIKPGTDVVDATQPTPEPGPPVETPTSPGPN